MLDATLGAVVVEQEAGRITFRECGTDFVGDEVVVVRALELDVPVLSPDCGGVSDFGEVGLSDGGGLLEGFLVGGTSGRVLGGGRGQTHGLFESQ